MSRVGKYFEDRTIAKAARIQKERTGKVETADKARLERMAVWNRAYTTSRDKIQKDIDNVVMKMKKAQGDALRDPNMSTQPYSPRLIIGDKVIVNRYSLTYEGYNGWDSGPSVLLDHRDKLRTTPLIFKVTGVKVAESYSEELLSRYLDEFDAETIRSATTAGYLRQVAQAVKRDRHGYEFLNEYGLYWDVHFDTESKDFEPKWGLNENSFLNIESPEGQETLALWEESISIIANYNKAKLDKDNLVTKISDANKKYNRYVS